MTPNDGREGPEQGALCYFRQLAEHAPGHPFIRVDGKGLSRLEFVEQVSLWASALARHGVGAGDYVALITPNGLVWYVAFWAAVSVGARPVPLDPQIGAWELERLLPLLNVRIVLSVARFRTSEIAINLVQASSRCVRPPLLVCLDGPRPGMVSEAEFLSGVASAPLSPRQVAEDEPLMLACTSGTTGNPKIIEVPHLGFVRSQLDMAGALSLSANDRMLLGMPLYHQGGFGMGLQTLLSGAEAIYLSTFDPQQFLATVQAHRVTVVQLSATLAKILLSHPKLDQFDLSSLRLAYFAGEVLPDEVAAEFWKKRGIRVVNVIGSSETATMVMWDSDRDSERSASEYCPLPFTRIHVGDWVDDRWPEDMPGTLWVATDALLTRYYANPSETEKRLVERAGARWFDTQDLVLRLADGYVRFVGRAKRALKRGPNLVHPEEVEAFLLTHEQIAAVAVGGDDHELYGDCIVAWVQPAEGASLTRGDLLSYCRGKIAAYKIPDRFVIVTQLPVDIGKVQHRRIRMDEKMTTRSTLNQCFQAALLRFPPERVAYATDRNKVTFGKLATAVRGFAAGLRAKGIGPGDTVGYSLPNCWEIIPLLLAIAQLGARAVPLFVQIPDSVRAGIFAALGCKLVLCDESASGGLIQSAAHVHAAYQVEDLAALDSDAEGDGSTVVEAAADQPVLAAATSGTTGIPKSVWITHGNAAAVLRATADFAELGTWQRDPGYSTMAAFPISTSSVLVVLGMICAGVATVFCRDLSPVHFLEMAEHHAVEALSAPPSYLEAILGLPPHLQRPLPKVRAVFTGMDSLHASLLARLAERFPNLDCAASGYGLVETSTVLMTWKAHDRAQLSQPPNVFSLCPSAGNRLDVRDDTGQSVADGQVGELWVSGPSVTSGYLGKPSGDVDPFVGGWFRTGDFVRRINSNTVELQGRKKYLIKRGGKSVSPLEVQDRIDACSGVRNSAVVGVGHPLYGEMIWAFVVPKEPQSANLKDVMKECRSRLPNYMVPDQVTFVDALPRGSGVGKLDREALIRMAEKELGKLQGESRG